MPPWGSVAVLPRVAAVAVLAPSVERPSVPNRDQQTVLAHLSESVSADILGLVHLAVAIAVDLGDAHLDLATHDVLHSRWQQHSPASAVTCDRARRQVASGLRLRR